MKKLKELKRKGYRVNELQIKHRATKMWFRFQCPYCGYHSKQIKELKFKNDLLIGCNNCYPNGVNEKLNKKNIMQYFTESAREIIRIEEGLG